MSTWLTDSPPQRVAAEGLLLRRWEVRDLEALNSAVMESRDHIGRWLVWAAGRTGRIQEQRDYLDRVGDRWDRRDGFDYGIFDPGSGSILGGIGVHPTPSQGEMEIGYWLHVARVGQGFATGAARAVTEAALALPGVERVTILCDEANHRSAAIPRRLGYELVEVRAVDGPRAPGGTGREMVWALKRPEEPDDDGRV